MTTWLTDTGSLDSPFCDGLAGNVNPICQLDDVAGGLASGIAGGVVREIAQAVVEATTEVLGAVLEFLEAPVSPDLQQGWYLAGVDKMLAVSGLFATLFFLAGLTQAVFQRSAAELGRVVGFTVGAFAASGIVLFLAQGFIALVDVASAQVASGTPQDMTETFAALVQPLTVMVTGSSGQAFLALLLGLFTAMAVLVIYVELFIRNVMIHVVVYFLPLMLIGTIWHPTRRWARRGIEFLAVLIFSKFVLYAVIALGWSAVASFDDEQLSTGWASVLTGLVLLTVAAFLPYLLFKMLPFMESHVGGALTRQDASRMATAPMSPVTSSMRTLDMNLGRAARLTALVGSGGTGAAVFGLAGGARSIGGGSASRALTAGERGNSPGGWVPSRLGGTQQSAPPEAAPSYAGWTATPALTSATKPAAARSEGENR